MPHDFKLWPELTNSQMDFYYFDSPHKQIAEDFVAKVQRVIDGDTISVTWRERDFAFPIRMLNINAPDKGEFGRERSKSWLEKQILGKEIDIIIDPNQRVGKWGRILGEIMHLGININQLSLDTGHSVPFEK